MPSYKPRYPQFRLGKMEGNVCVANYQSTGNTPRNFALDPMGNFRLVSNQNSYNIVIFSRNKKTGGLIPIGKPIGVGSPSCLQFVLVQKCFYGLAQKAAHCFPEENQNILFDFHIINLFIFKERTHKH